MAAVTICSDFGAQESKGYHCFHCFPIYLPWSDETGCHDLSFLNTEFYATCVHISLCHVFLVFVSWIPWSFFFFLAFYYFDIFEKCRSDIYSISLIFGLLIFLVVTFRLCILVQEYHSSDTQVMSVFLRTSCLMLLTLVTWLSWYPPLDTSFYTGKLISSFYD